ncbi:mucin-2-like [Armigeres subalbatus]|uniref:mucin-2-like n=1 Tax=Armigeres subalbatus TaxID=124917 RepID=UPI002ED250B6
MSMERLNRQLSSSAITTRSKPQIGTPRAIKTSSTVRKGNPKKLSLVEWERFLSQGGLKLKKVQEIEKEVQVTEEQNNESKQSEHLQEIEVHHETSQDETTKLLINRDSSAQSDLKKRPFPAPRFRHSRRDNISNTTRANCRFQNFLPTTLLFILADEHLAELMPIFEQLRAQGNLPCTYPLHVTSSGTAFIRGGSRSTPLSPHAPHCHPSTHWVRERSSKSISMSRPSRSSLSASTPDSLSDNESSLGTPGRFQTPNRKTSVPIRSQMTPGGSRTNSRPSSRPASRAGSKPPSRHGSTLSLDSTDDATPSRIPTRRVTSTTTPRPSRLSVGSTTTNTRTTNGVSSRTASGAASPAPTRNGGMSRSSSIPTLVGLPNSSHRSRIPVRQMSNVSNSSSATGKTSGTSTPSGMQTPRRTSVEPQTPGSTRPDRSSRGTTPATEKRAPFRL